MPDITKEYHIHGYKYKWNINSKLPISFDNENNQFIIDGNYSYTYINVISKDEIYYNIIQTNIGQVTLYSAEVTTKENIKKFEPWVIISTMPKNNVPPAMRRNIINTNISVNNFTSTNLNFTSGYKQYYINIYNDYNSENDTNKTDNIVYTENRENVIISSD